LNLQISVVIPVHNGAATLAQCLLAVAQSSRAPKECIVIDDGSTDGSDVVGKIHGATVISLDRCFGPARARNVGAWQASGDLLVFLDADVTVHPEALERMASRFEQEPELDALTGAYDDSPADPGLVSQFKNLMHSFVHREGNAKAFSFWCGCGGVKRQVYLDHGGLDESYKRPAIEDIEFGFRLMKSGRKLALDPRVQCKHLKAWTLWSWMQTDIFQRGIPWTKLILRTGFLPDDLNLRWSQRILVSLCSLLPILVGVMAWQTISGKVLVSPSACVTSSATIVALIPLVNRNFYSFLASCRGWGFSISVLPLHVLYHLNCAASLLLGIWSYLLERLTSVNLSTNVPPVSGAGQL